MNNKLLEIGSTITIERSDGRIHAASVSKIDYDMKTVDVEWLEENLTRGKQLYFQTVLELNPTVKILNINNSCSELTILNKVKKSKIKLPQSSRLSEAHTIQNSTRSLIGKIENERMKRRQRQAECKKDKLEITKKIMNNPYYEWEQMIYEYWKNLKRQPLRDNNNVANDHVITVCVRKRPLNKIELLKKEIDIITITTKNQLILHEPKTKIDLTKFLNHQLFKFDLVFDENCTNDCIYKFTAKPLIENIFNGGYSTCFAYGQTGSGKTYTIFGDNKNKQQQQQQQQGIYTLIIKDIFKSINSSDYRTLNLLISCSFFEIYSRKILDLFNNKQELKILEDNKQQIQIIGLTEKFINKIDDLFKLIENGNNLRTSGSTKANKNSSRSHAILQISLKRFINNKFELYGKFSLIDLAGNERGTNTMNTTKVTHMESAEINKSLLALKECIRALERKDGAHLPFRLSKLTQILRDSFIGTNTRTCMIATVAPNINSCDDSLNTLRYADRVKELSNDNNHNDDSGDDQEMMVIDDDDKEDDESSDLIFVKRNHDEIVKKLQETYERIKDFSELSGTNLNVYCENLQLIIDRTIEFLLNSKSSLMKFNRN